ncbi:hypothetical protein F511_04421 [Dorcoceras hygrometricum]|uniref:Uncharacterized protein n=1 Tax=Dorcoceras hygrometricum TaxID=472368 RepID=A0A2Z7D8A1_9LAMI|nr:hypothetical protein F511_04421 [Dorcoceras hygrometricum]
MAGLQRSVVSFRRQGSSGLVWDDKLTQLIDQQEKEKNKLRDEREQDPSATGYPAPPPELTIERSRSNGGGRGFRTGRVSAAIEPPSPKVSACGLCSAFGKQGKNPRRRRLPPKRAVLRLRIFTDLFKLGSEERLSGASKSITLYDFFYLYSLIPLNVQLGTRGKTSLRNDTNSPPSWHHQTTTRSGEHLADQARYLGISSHG